MSLIRKRQFGEIIDEANESTFKRPLTNKKNIAILFSVKPDQTHIDIPGLERKIIVGRSSTCDIRIGGTDVSSKHCELTLVHNNNRDYLSIKDISSNGVFINDELLGKHSSTLLKSGDKVTFAKTGGVYIFRYYVDLEESKKRNKKSFFDDYILGDQLGTGHYAVVKEAKDRRNGSTVAVKIFHPNRATGKVDNAKLEQEMNLLLSINHPNIVKFISRYVEPTNQNSVTTYLVLEKMNNGELFQRIINKLKLRQDETKAIFDQLLSGLKYLHENNIIHRDIKPENILLDIVPRTSGDQIQTGPWDEDEYDVKVKIADFGLAKFIGELKFTNTLCGTPAYVAPEILNNNRYYTTKADIWLSGVLLYVCICGFPPFSEELGPPNMREQILNGKYAFYSPYWDEINDSVLDLISNLLVVNPEERYDINQTCSHFWFNEDEEVAMSQDSDTLSSATHMESIKRITVRADSMPISIKERYISELNSDADKKT